MQRRKETLQNDLRDLRTSINFNADWRFFHSTYASSYDNEYTLFSYNDEDWISVALPHYGTKSTQRFTTICTSYWYRKRFNVKQTFDKYQHVYLYFELKSNDTRKDKTENELKIPDVTIWLNECKLFFDTLPQAVNLTGYLKNDFDNLIVIHSKRGHLLRLHARLVSPRHLTGQINLDEIHHKPVAKQRKKIVDYAASFDHSNGRISVSIQHTDQYAGPNNVVIHENYNGENSDDYAIRSQEIKEDENLDTQPTTNIRIPRLAILILIVGTRGDVQPFIALAKTLLTYGHRVRLATHEVFRKFVRENGIEFYPLAGDPADLMSFMVKNAGIVPSISSIFAGDIARNQRIIADILASTWKACIEDDDETGVSFIAEAIIANPPSYGHIHCAQKLQIPLHMMFTMPWSPTAHFPHPFIKLDYNRASIERINMLSYHLVELLSWTSLHNIINEFRKKVLSLPPLHTRQAVRLMIDKRVPHTYCWSPSIVPKPADWPKHIDVSGFFFLDLATNFTPPNDLVQFLEAGDPPIYIGFGSITGHDSERILHVVIEALRITGYRVVLLGLAKETDELPDTIFRIGNCPHDWLFQHVSAVCHHGGAGTTAAGLRAGKPTIIVPFFGDQFFWGSMISKSGAGPVPIPGKTITAKQLAAAFKFVHEPEALAAAQQISLNFQNENGCEAAVQSFHANLPIHKMYSDLEPTFVAHFQLNHYNLKISRPVAQVLISTKAITLHELKLNDIQDWDKPRRKNQSNIANSNIDEITSRFSSIGPTEGRSKSAHHSEMTRSHSLFSLEKYDLINLGRPFRVTLPLYGEVKEENKQQNSTDLKSQSKAKLGVRYGIASIARTHPLSQISNRVPTSCSTNFDNNLNESNRTPRITRPTPMYFAHQTQVASTPPTTRKSQRSSSIKEKSSPKKDDDTASTLLDNKAAEMSGFPVNLCKEILAEFQQKKYDLQNPIASDISTSQFRTRLPVTLNRQRSRSSVIH